MRTITLVGFAFALVACGHDTTGPAAAPVTVSGTYVITTLDGLALPVTVLDLGAYKAKLVSGTLNLKTDQTYSFEYGIRIEDSGNVRTQLDTDGGVWTRTNNAVTLTNSAGNFSQTGSVSGGVLTLESSGVVFKLTKQQP
jgi:hypothetical protein